MATSDKHCQTLCVKSAKTDADTNEYAAMYDATVPVLNAREVESPPESGDEVLVAAMAKFTPPARPAGPARHDFDSDSESDSEPEKFLNNATDEDLSPDRKSPRGREPKTEMSRQSSKDGAKSLSKQASQQMDSSDNSDSDDNSLEAARVPALPSGRRRAVAVPAEGAYDPQQYQGLKVPADMENVFQYIMKYTPQKIDIEFKLQPFVPDYVPAVGDPDAFIKVTTPACNARGKDLAENVLEHIDNLGLSLVDEPAARQSDAALLQLQLRALSKTSSARPVTVMTKKIDDAERNPKAIDRWIRDVSELHLAKPAPTVTYTVKMPDIDSLMQEWPETMEETLNDVGFPPADLDCSLSQYADLVCGLLDIPVAGDTLNDRIQALHMLFSLYSAVKASQLYAEREKEKAENL
ncbi:intraflagellar transport protein 46 homolog [Plutella xylostella]|uniref:intraflagellar transport protein 46 homolog n=1 Tax=Plutella xylostella TaxID=51655 RepID=UPI0020329B17|nr:intraflagellar transport protein 46 homolog [Plutella xylostella]